MLVEDVFLTGFLNSILRFVSAAVEANRRDLKIYVEPRTVSVAVKPVGG